MTDVVIRGMLDVPSGVGAKDPYVCLKRPWIREQTFYSHSRRFLIHVADQPGRWMPDHELDQLYCNLITITRDSMDEVPTYGIFGGERSAFENRVIGVTFDTESGEPVAFTALVYLPYAYRGKWRLAVHLGLTMIARTHRGSRLQTPLFRRVMLLPVLNQRRISFVITNIAASPAGIGAVSDYFENVYPNYNGSGTCTSFHLTVAQQILQRYRHEFGCSVHAHFNPDTFVVHGSNAPEGGGAHQFIREDPTSRYRVEDCNTFCSEHLDFSAGDELFQVGEVSLLGGLWSSRRGRRSLSQRSSGEVGGEATDRAR